MSFYQQIISCLLIQVVVLAICVSAQTPTAHDVAVAATRLADSFGNASATLFAASAPANGVCPYMRFAHVKQQACFSALFSVLPGLPASLAKGVFNSSAQGGRLDFQALVSFVYYCFDFVCLIFDFFFWIGSL